MNILGKPDLSSAGSDTPATSMVECNSFFISSSSCIYHARTGLLEHWDHGFESNFREEFLPTFYYVMLSCEGRGLGFSFI
jgi:hypothetical protein